MKKRRRAFTLAEVLVTLTIIGVIAAITVPALIQRTNKQEYVTALQKAYSTLSQASQRIIAENGSPKGEDGWAKDNDTVYNLYKKYLNNAKDCGTGAGCNNQIYKRLDGAGNYGGNWDSISKYDKLVLADGVQLLFESMNTSCVNSFWGSDKYCGFIWADINGGKKPNTHGRDVFAFVLKEDGLYPAGCGYNSCTGSGDNGIGVGCACKVLREGAMNY